MQSGDSETTPNAELDTVEDKSRRTFLKAAVVASAAVVVAGGAAGFAIASGKAPTRFLSFVGFAASGKDCILIQQAVKVNDNNPNKYIQVNKTYIDNFGSASSTLDGNGNYPLTFTRCGSTHQISFTLTEFHQPLSISGTLVETGGDNGTYSYQNGSNTVLYLGYKNVTGDTSHTFSEQACLTLSCS